MNFAVREILSLVLYRRQSFLFPKKKKERRNKETLSTGRRAAKRAQREMIQLSFEKKLFLWGREKKERKKERKGDLHARRKSTKSRKTKTWIPFREERIIRGRAAKSRHPRVKFARVEQGVYLRNIA